MNTTITILLDSALCVAMMVSASFAQTEAFRVNSASDISLIYIGNDGSVAVDTSTTLGSLTVNGNNGIISLGTYGSGSALSLGAGTRMMWYPKRSAFRAGAVDGTQWDDGNIGGYSTAIGFDTKASGPYSNAMGYGTTSSGYASTAIGWATTATNDEAFATGQGTKASGYNSTAMGRNTTAGGQYSLAAGYGSTANADNSVAMGIKTTASGYASTTMGDSTTAGGDEATAMGRSTTASGIASTAMGYGTTASGSGSLAIGYSANTLASGIGSIALGYYAIASGNYSTAIGNFVSTNGYNGAVVIGDRYNTLMMSSTTDDQMLMRSNNGYVFYTSWNLVSGIQLAGGANSWSTISDSTKKENFLPVNGEDILNKIDKFDLRTWNYKGQDPTKYRHYGPMAQEFFNAFGHDRYGVIGNDTTINQADFEGVLLVAVQALEKRSEEHMQEIRSQRQELQSLKAAYETIAEKLNKIEKSTAASGEIKVAHLQK